MTRLRMDSVNLEEVIHSAPLIPSSGLVFEIDRSDERFISDLLADKQPASRMHSIYRY